jgi:hypothetical protein
MPEFIAALFDTTQYPPRWVCGNWSAPLGWAHILSDIAIWGAYTGIPLTLAFFAVRRRDVPFTPLFWLFAAFIFSCGSTHLVEAIIFWSPIYNFSALMKIGTALVSWVTLIALIRIAPQALELPRMAKLNEELTIRALASEHRFERGHSRHDRWLVGLGH